MAKPERADGGRPLSRIALSVFGALALVLGLVVFSNGISQASPDDAPTITDIATTQPGSGALAVEFVPPVDTTVPVVTYQVSTDGGTHWAPTDVRPTDSTLVVDGLRPGTEYDIALRAVHPTGSTGSASLVESATPDPLATPTVTPAVTPSATAFVSASATPNPTASPTGSVTGSPTATASASASPTASPTGSPTGSSTARPTASPTASASGTPMITPSASASPTATSVPGAPGAPTAVTGEPDDKEVTVSWKAPLVVGNSPILSYTVTSTPGSFTCTTTKTSCTVDKLTNGVAYTFTVTAINATGISVPSLKSASVTPGPVSGPPAAPSIADVSVGDGEVEVTVLPAVKGGLADSFTVTSSPGKETCKATKATKYTCTVDKLVNGKEYVFTATATNEFGTSEPSDPSKPVTPIAGPPGAPVVTFVRADDEVADVYVAKGKGGKPTSYLVTSSPGGLTCLVDDEKYCEVSDLVNGTTYTFTATATNAAGTSKSSLPSDPVTPHEPANLPSVPTITSIVVGDRIATITIAAGAGGGAPDAYVVNSSPDDYQCSTTSNVCVITGLDNGTSYTFTVKARNEVGGSKWSSPSRSVVPVARND